jgi:hypothetical protein
MITVVKTPHGDIVPYARNTKAITVFRYKSHRNDLTPVGTSVKHHGRWRKVGEIGHLCHRKLPVSCSAAKGAWWVEWLGTYDLKGNPIELRCIKCDCSNCGSNCEEDGTSG